MDGDGGCMEKTYIGCPYKDRGKFCGDHVDDDNVSSRYDVGTQKNPN